MRMKPTYRFLAAAMLLAVTTFAVAQDAEREAIRLEIEALENPGPESHDGSDVASPNLLTRIYEAREFSPAWNRLAQVAELVDLVKGASRSGLDPEDYRALAVGAGFRALRDAAPLTPAMRARLDILFTDALIRLAYHQRFGKVNPYTLDPEWNFNRRLATANAADTIQAAIDSTSLREYMQTLLPRGWAYTQLERALANYRSIAANGGWPQLPEGPTLRPGDSDARIATLARRLAVTGDLEQAHAEHDGERYTPRLEAAVRRFQARHGLAVDGVIGSATREAMNITAAERIRQLEINLERARWVFDDLADEFILVNIAGFRVYLVRAGQIIWESRAQVGKTYRKTPIFRDEMKYLVFNPTWTVPYSIATRDLLPQIQADPGFFEQRGFDVRDRDGQAIEPSQVAWDSLSRGSFPYTLVQRPGPANALGRVKFMFPNEHAVYLHDTPSKSLFERADRAFSAGCIRVEHPFELAELLLGRDGWTQQRFGNVLETGKEQTVFLSQPVPVLLLYWTAQVSPDGVVHFYRDIYERDQAIAEALDEPFQLDAPAP